MILNVPEIKKNIEDIKTIIGDDNNGLVKDIKRINNSIFMI